MVATALFSVSATANTNSTIKNELQKTTEVTVTNDNGDEDQYQENWKFFGIEIKTGPCTPLFEGSDVGLQTRTEVLYVFGIPVSTAPLAPGNCVPQKVTPKIEDIN